MGSASLHVGKLDKSLKSKDIYMTETLHCVSNCNCSTIKGFRGGDRLLKDPRNEGGWVFKCRACFLSRPF
jgi:hypothetical protein